VDESERAAGETARGQKGKREASTTPKIASAARSSRSATSRPWDLAPIAIQTPSCSAAKSDTSLARALSVARAKGHRVRYKAPGRGGWRPDCALKTVPRARPSMHRA